MLDSNEIRWVKSTANDLNNLIQVISDSSQLLESLCAQTEEDHRYFSILKNGVERASKVISSMVERVDGYSDGSALLNATPALTPQPLTIQCLESDLHLDWAPIKNPSGARELVLIVDDEEFICLLAEHVLTGQGYRVITATDGFKAIDIYRKLQHQISLIILDFAMPVLDGGDVFEELLLINPKVPVVLSSGFTEHSRLSSMLGNGLRGFIPKPYTKEKLLSQVRAVLDAIGAEQKLKP